MQRLQSMWGTKKKEFPGALFFFFFFFLDLAQWYSPLKNINVLTSDFIPWSKHKQISPHNNTITLLKNCVEIYIYIHIYIPPFITLSIITCRSRVNGAIQEKEVAPFPTLRCCSYWKGSIRITSTTSGQVTYIYIKKSWRPLSRATRRLFFQ